MTIPLQKGIIYGPVQSRRLGRSLGINLLPTKRKYCNFNCLYCQYGWSNYTLLPPTQLPSISQISSALTSRLSQLDISPEFITFSGNGEPTLHPAFPEILEITRNIRDEIIPQAKIALLTNSTTIVRPEIFNCLFKIDKPILKMDAANQTVLGLFNDPQDEIQLDHLISLIKELPVKIIQALFAGGKFGNFNQEHVEQWTETMISIHPHEIQLYSLDRSFPSSQISKLPKKQLEKISEPLQKAGIKCNVY